MDPTTVPRDWPPDSFQIKRKPVSNPNLRRTAIAVAPGTTSAGSRPPVTLQPPSYTELYGSASQDASQSSEHSRPLTAGNATLPSSQLSSSAQSPSQTPVQKAYVEARHFLGGLINHPTESNKHVTILRHSHGLVFYRGKATSVAVSIFSDAPLPSDRTLWLQSRGWSGKTGMRAKALLHLRDSWVDVTPSMPLRAEQVIPEDERAWQRDIKKFLKKAPARLRETHQLRETAVMRIPAQAGDGYFQLVLCQGLKKKVLGNSPVFRVLSTSTNPSSLRGASLSTLPLEVGAMVVSLYAQTAAQTIVSPTTAAIKSKVNPYRPSWLTQTAAQTAYSASNIQDKVVGALHASSRPSHLAPSDGSTLVSTGSNPTAIEEGPQPPFPMSFKACAQLSPASSLQKSETSKLALKKVPDWVTQELRGYFFGWGRFESGNGKDESLGPWCPIILSVRRLDSQEATRVDITQMAKPVVQVRFLDEVPVQSTKLDLRILGFLRAGIPPPVGRTSQELADAQATAMEAAALADAYDVAIVQNTLAHPSWTPEPQILKEPLRQNHGWMDRTRGGYATMRARGQKLVEQVPLHRLGIRSATDEWREKQVAVDGFYIVR